MGSKKSWFSSVKKVLSPDSEGKKAERADKSKKKWFRKEKPSVSDFQNPGTVEVSYPHPLPPLEDVKLAESEDEPTKHAYAVAVVTAAADDEDVTVTPVTPEISQPCAVDRFAGKSKEEVAAIRIQTAFRGYLAGRALRALRGLVRLKSLVDGPIVNRQTANTLKCMQALSRVQSQIQSRRIRMLEENRALQRQLLQKRAKELESLKMGEEWDHSLQSKEQIEASLLHKYEAAMRRERALAYSYTHQQMWKKSARSSNLLFMDPTNPHWGWSWLERWMAARPWEAQSSTGKDSNSDSISTKSAIPRTSQGEITKSFARHLINSENPSSPIYQKPPSSYQSPGTPTPPKAAASSVVARKLKPTSPRGSALSQEDDSRSIISLQSERNRRHSIAGSSVRDDESLGSSMPVPSYMASTHSAKAKSKLPSPLGMENGNTPEKGSVKKRLSFPPSPDRGRRHSGPPKVDTSSISVSGVAN
ncbi:protein IQ-DOMAIN 2-like [Primulina huaijiensis]|uniref:protein IQ-DOMAIN 2-like n=1 Tax=Primulina huaijiensis TaxID=1492673 RepID=UPI003CC7225F